MRFFTFQFYNLKRCSTFCFNWIDKDVNDFVTKDKYIDFNF